ncbi:hypothetical protein SUGI_0015460 [Cryptomeria japonica]|uniref:cytochrome P450 724B1-like n=1 Tax=Cryptomeria japonica TaxID=3369 RepID=UPI0024089711|nr:cytochrome P450 724B1-like [Cryptomeria japonica]GLJ05290.1 hypothetical protein SUGI_0015460 [Cryptomeria japonica]
MILSRAGWWTVFACLAGLAWIFILHFRSWILSRGKKLPPGNMGWPLIGETFYFMKPHPSTSTGTFLQKNCKLYGKIFSSHVFGQPTIVSCDFDFNMYVLLNEDRLFQSSYPKSVNSILGEFSMLIAVGDAHKRMRSLALNMINTAKKSTGFLNDIEWHALYVFDHWNHQQDIVFSKEAKKFTFNLMVKQLVSLMPGSPQSSQILSDLLTFMDGLVAFPLNIPGTHYSKALKSRSRILSTLKGMIHQRRNGNDVLSGDFLDSLITNTNLSDEEILNLVMDLIFGGYETTSTLIALILKFLTECPKALQQIKSEHEAIKRAKGKDESLTFDDYRQMTFTQNVIDETLRLGNVVKFVHRKTIKDIKFKDYDIPAGWKVLPILSAVHLDSSNYDNPFEFNPWRWQEPTTGKRFIPFGGGARLCPGYEMGRIEAAVFIHHLLLKFRWRMREPDIPMSYPYLDFEKGLCISVERL